jgi:hypothetical protein
MLLVFLFHCARFFGGGGWHLKNPGEESLIATLFIGILDLWLMPLYIFHQTIILCVGWFVIRWDMGILLKYLIIAVVSFILIMVLYEMLVRPFNVMRFLFGMRPKRKPAAPSAAPPEGFGA